MEISPLAILLPLMIYVSLGALVGWLASMVKGRNALMGIRAHIIVGIIGAVIGGYLVYLLGIGYYSAITLPGLVIAVISAIILLGLEQIPS
jgi:uncharacterized membrane protein YeaQ/YmgE (transglycosylase-associated protein family)